MFVEEILKSASNSVVEGTYLLNDPKLRPFNDKEGHFFTFNLQDKTGVVWAKIWDNAENIAQKLKEQDIQIVTIQGRTNLYNNKVQVIVDKIKKADTYEIKDLIKLTERDPEDMFSELVSIINSVLHDKLSVIANYYFENTEFLEKFKKWPGGKGVVHHAYQHGLLEHTLSVTKLVESFQMKLGLPINIEIAVLGAFLHDIGKIDAYDFNIKTSMTNIGRLHEHTVLGYYKFRRDLDRIEDNMTSDLVDKEQIIEDIGHIILSHHGTYQQHAIIKPMSIEAKLVAFADYLDSDTNYMAQQLQHNSDEQGWVFDTLNEQFFFKRHQQLKKRKLLI
jgi:3'-5' exoribonuclease